jgi:hypothetical protein
MDSNWSDRLLAVGWVVAWSVLVYFVPFSGW